MMNIDRLKMVVKFFENSSSLCEREAGRDLGKIFQKIMVVAVVFTSILWNSGPSHAVTLLTPQEAMLGEMPENDGPAAASLDERRFVVPESAVNGPDIQVISPEPERVYPSPLKVLVKFVPREGTQVDLSGLKVECLKIIAINITDRIRAYITNQGIDVDKAELPSGAHKIRVTLRDTGGGVTSKVFTVKVQ